MFYMPLETCERRAAPSVLLEAMPAVQINFFQDFMIWCLDYICLAVEVWGLNNLSKERIAPAPDMCAFGVQLQPWHCANPWGGMKSLDTLRCREEGHIRWQSPRRGGYGPPSPPGSHCVRVSMVLAPLCRCGAEAVTFPRPQKAELSSPSAQGGGDSGQRQRSGSGSLCESIGIPSQSPDEGWHARAVTLGPPHYIPSFFTPQGLLSQSGFPISPPLPLFFPHFFIPKSHFLSLTSLPSIGPSAHPQHFSSCPSPPSPPTSLSHLCPLTSCVCPLKQTKSTPTHTFQALRKPGCGLQLPKI